MTFQRTGEVGAGRLAGADGIEKLEYHLPVGSGMQRASDEVGEIIHRRVFLPEGRWVHFWTGKVYRGGRGYTVRAPLGQPPVFWREGSPYAPLFRKTAKEFQ